MFSVGIFAASERACMNSWRGVSPSSAKMQSRVAIKFFQKSGWCSVLPLQRVRSSRLWLEVLGWMNFVLCMEVLVLNNVSVAM